MSVSRGEWVREKKLKQQRDRKIIYIGLMVLTGMAILGIVLPASKMARIGSERESGLLTIDDKREFRSFNREVSYMYTGRLNGGLIQFSEVKNLQVGETYAVLFDTDNPSDFLFGEEDEPFLTLYLREGNPAVIVICIGALPFILYGLWRMHPRRRQALAKTSSNALPLP